MVFKKKWEFAWALIVVVCCVHIALAQQTIIGCRALQKTTDREKLSSMQSTTSLPNAPSYRPPTQKERACILIVSNLGPLALGRTALFSAMSLGLDSPPQWGQDAAGYGQRFGARMAQFGGQSITDYLLADALHEDPRFFPCWKCSFKQKLRTAVRETFTSPVGSDGHRRLSVAKLVSPFAGAVVIDTMNPNTALTTGTIAQQAVVGFSGRFASNLFREFWGTR